jgi:glycosyltransferase involved in cell wall biosynthesis
MQPNAPDYSIIVPTYRRPDSLARCLRAIEALDFDRNRFELLVVDDGSPAPPTDLVASLDPSIQARLLCTRHAGPATARNTGARAARARYVVFTDDDCQPREDWLRSIDQCVGANRGSVAIGGRVVNVLADNIYAAASQGIVDYLYEYYGENPAPNRFFTSNNLVLPRAEFLRIGGFNETFALPAAEDRDLCERWLTAGNRLEYAADAVVRHAHALSFVRFNRQHFTYGRGAVDLQRSRAERGERSLKLEPLRFYSGLVTYPVRRLRSGRGLVLGALHLWSQVAYASGYYFERTRRGWAVNGAGHPPGADDSRDADDNDDAESATGSGSMSSVA